MSKIKTNQLENVAGTSGYDIRESFSFRNKLINGGFDIWQRGTNFTVTGSGAYTSDRWLVRGSGIVGGTVNVSKSQYIADGGHANHIVLNHVGGTNNGYIAQKVEGKGLSGKTITISGQVYVDNVCDIALREIVTENSVIVNDTTTTKTKITQTGTWVDFSLTVDAYTTLTGIEYVGDNMGYYLQYYGDGVDAVGTNIIRFRNVQIEEGSIATPFEVRPIGYELSLCRRYYRRYESGSGTYLCTGAVWSSTVAYFVMPLEVPMVTTPTLEVSNGADFQVLEGGSVHETTTITFVGTSRRDMVGFTATSSGLTVGNACMFRFDSLGTRFLAFNAEL